MDFKEAKTEKEISEVYNYDFGVFSDSLDFEWSEDALKKAKKEGWKIFSLVVEEQIIAALLVKYEKNSLLTKNTPIKLTHQGHSYSDRIKEFYEVMAEDLGAKKIYHYCRVDDFRMISLNEDFGYKKTGKSLGKENQLIEWEKKLS